MKKLTLYPGSKNLFKVIIISFTPNAICLIHWLEQQFHYLSVNTIGTGITKKPGLVMM